MSSRKTKATNPRNVLRYAFFVPLFFLFCAPLSAATSRKQVSETPVDPVNNARGSADNSATFEGFQVYQTVSPNKSLLTSPQFRVIDDFNSKEWKTRLNSFWRLENGKAGEVTMEHSREDARGLRPGHSLKIGFDLKDRQQFTLYSSLEKLDMSQARFLAMKCKLEPRPKTDLQARARVSLTDWTGRTVTRDITDVCTNHDGRWSEAVLPMSFFKGLDFDQLTKISFTVIGRGRRSRASFSLDEIAFFGPNEMGFESALDNIKNFPKLVKDHRGKEELLATANNREFLKKIGQSTWRYFEEAADKDHHLVLDHVKVGDSPMVGVYTSPTNIAMDLMGGVAAFELGYISREEAQKRTGAILSSLRGLKRWKGFFYNFYETTKLSVTREFISSVDNSWLAAALIVVRQAFPGPIADEASKILDGFDFKEFYDPDTNHVAIGYDMARKGLTPYHYGMLVTEARTMSFIGIGKGDFPEEHWWHLYRTAPEAWEWQTQKPEGRWVTRAGIEYFQGYYMVDSKKTVPSWGGSLFEFLMPTLVVPEGKLAPKSFGKNNLTASEIHRDYALKEKNYPVWGISPAAVASGRRWIYGEYGIRKLGAKGYPDKGVIAPYASMLALGTIPDDVVANLRKMLADYDVYGEYGFYDSINIKNGLVTFQYLALDQGMSLIAIANYLKNGAIQEYFMKDPIAKKSKTVLEGESFF
ncbi:MAG: hypothetical protein BWY42_01402 [Candidatus Omnitrophica bacterium ADurb.Bin277]|nr:MAG: hypothetical protein BWY42_01402 [Candidatus Omnitrophica bacterium ADurb.Bin277]